MAEFELADLRRTTPYVPLGRYGRARAATTDDADSGADDSARKRQRKREDTPPVARPANSSLLNRRTSLAVLSRPTPSLLSAPPKRKQPDDASESAPRRITNQQRRHEEELMEFAGRETPPGAPAPLADAAEVIDEDDDDDVIQEPLMQPDQPSATEDEDEETFAAYAPGGDDSDAVDIPSAGISRLRKYHEHGPKGICFACIYAPGGRVAQIARSGMEFITNVIKSANSGACRVRLSEAIKRYYDLHIRKPGNHPDILRPGQAEFPEWPVRQIYAHYFTAAHGRLNARESEVRRILWMEEVLETFANNGLFQLKRVNGRVRKIVDLKILDSFLDVSKEVHKLYIPGPGRKNGIGNDVATVPTESASAVFHGQQQLYGAPSSTYM